MAVPLSFTHPFLMPKFATQSDKLRRRKKSTQSEFYGKLQQYRKRHPVDKRQTSPTDAPQPRKGRSPP